MVVEEKASAPDTDNFVDEDDKNNTKTPSGTKPRQYVIDRTNGKSKIPDEKASSSLLLCPTVCPLSSNLLGAERSVRNDGKSRLCTDRKCEDATHFVCLWYRCQPYQLCIDNLWYDGLKRGLWSFADDFLFVGDRDSL
jgi:hypothetical protein